MKYFSFQAVAVFLVLNIPRLLLLVLVLLNFQSCRVSLPYILFSCCPALGINLPLSHLTKMWLTFSPPQAVVDSFPQAGDLRHHPSTAVNIIFFTVKLCTLLNRQAMFFPLEHQQNIKPSSPTAPSTSSSTASWARVSGEAWGVCSRPVLVSWKEQRHRWNKVQYLVASYLVCLHEKSNCTG